MIKSQLTSNLKLGKLYNVYLINTDNPLKALDEITEFLSNNFYKNQNINSHPDFYLVQKSENNVKNITVEQIRQLQSFLTKTSVISGIKTAVICNAEDMNTSAANSCLKLLEDTPKNTHIFLITKNSAIILPTILSRCAKINYYFDIKESNIAINAVDDYYITPFLKTTNIAKHLDYFKSFANKDLNLWVKVAQNTQKLLSRISQKLADQLSLDLSPMEAKLLEQMAPISLQELTFKYDKVVNLANSTINFDLDLKTSYILLIDIVTNANLGKC